MIEVIVNKGRICSIRSRFLFFLSLAMTWPKIFIVQNEWNVRHFQGRNTSETVFRRKMKKPPWCDIRSLTLFTKRLLIFHLTALHHHRHHHWKYFFRNKTWDQTFDKNSVLFYVVFCFTHNQCKIIALHIFGWVRQQLKNDTWTETSKLFLFKFLRWFVVNECHQVGVKDSMLFRLIGSIFSPGSLQNKEKNHTIKVKANINYHRSWIGVGVKRNKILIQQNFLFFTFRTFKQQSSCRKNF